MCSIEAQTMDFHTCMLCYTDTALKSCVDVGHRVRQRYVSDTYRRSIGGLNIKKYIFNFRHVLDTSSTRPRHGPAQ